MEEGNRALKSPTLAINCSGLWVWLLLITHWPEPDTQPDLTTRGQEGATLPSAWKQEKRDIWQPPTVAMGFPLPSFPPFTSQAHVPTFSSC